VGDGGGEGSVDRTELGRLGAGGWLGRLGVGEFGSKDLRCMDKGIHFAAGMQGELDGGGGGGGTELGRF